MHITMDTYFRVLTGPFPCSTLLTMQPPTSPFILISESHTSKFPFRWWCLNYTDSLLHRCTLNIPQCVSPATIGILRNQTEVMDSLSLKWVVVRFPSTIVKHTGREQIFDYPWCDGATCVDCITLTAAERCVRWKTGLERSACFFSLFFFFSPV